MPMSIHDLFFCFVLFWETESILLRTTAYNDANCVEEHQVSATREGLVHVKECIQYPSGNAVVNVVLECERDGVIRGYLFHDSICSQPATNLLTGAHSYIDIIHTFRAGGCAENTMTQLWNIYSWSGVNTTFIFKNLITFAKIFDFGGPSADWPNLQISSKICLYEKIWNLLQN